MPDENGCTCNDEFVTEPCPVHSAMDQARGNFGQNRMIITDELLISKEQGFFQGFIFMCPACNKPAIMVNPSMGKFCCNCAQPVEIQSKHVTDFIRNQYKRR